VTVRPEIYLSHLDNDRRTNAYIDYANDILNSGVDGALEAYHQLMITAQISSYSGPVGGAAILGNLNAWHESGGVDGVYGQLITNGFSLDEFSKHIAQTIFNAVRVDLEQGGGDGIFTGAELRALSYAGWDSLDLAEYFPGNYQRDLDRDNNYENVNFSQAVLDEVFDGDVRNYQGDETGVFTLYHDTAGPRIGVNLDVVNSSFSASAYASDFGNMPWEFRDAGGNFLFTRQEVRDFLSPSETLPDGSSQLLHNDGYVLERSGKVVNTINFHSSRYFDTGGRFVEEDLSLGNEINQAGFWVINSITDGLVGLRSAFRNPFETRSDRLEQRGDILKNKIGADLNGVRHTVEAEFTGLTRSDESLVSRAAFAIDAALEGVRSSIGRATDSLLNSDVFHDISQSFGEILDDAFSPEEADFTEVFGEEGVAEAFNNQALEEAISGAGMGTVSSLLAAEFVDATGLTGAPSDFFGQISEEIIQTEGIFSTTAASFINQVNDHLFQDSEGGGGNFLGMLGAELVLLLGLLFVAATQYAGPLGPLSEVF